MGDSIVNDKIGSRNDFEVKEYGMFYCAIDFRDCDDGP
jgi:hypothetical protein